jgi:hypothetical protein
MPLQGTDMVVAHFPNLEQNELASWRSEFLGVGERLLSKVRTIKWDENGLDHHEPPFYAENKDRGSAPPQHPG